MTHASYMNRAFTDRNEILSEADKLLSGVAFDTFVGTGISGTIVATLLADLGKGNHDFAIVRKNDDRSTHSWCRIEGSMSPDTRFVFVDDFVQSGETLIRVLETIEMAMNENYPTMGKLPKMVGTYLYQNYQFTPTQVWIDRLGKYSSAYSSQNSELHSLLKKFV